MLIVEGPDGGGKTTLIQGLIARYGFEVATRVVSKEAHALTNLKVWTEQNLFAGFQDLIFDRHRLISQPIYGPLLGRPSPPWAHDLVWNMMAYTRFYQINPLIIYCMPPKQIVLANVQGDPDNQAVASQIEFIYDAYVARAAQDLTRPSARVTIWDYTRDGQEENPLAKFDAPIYHLFDRRPSN